VRYPVTDAGRDSEKLVIEKVWWNSRQFQQHGIFIASSV